MQIMSSQDLSNHSELFRPCAVPDPDFVIGVHNIFKIRGWPKIPLPSACVSDVLDGHLFSRSPPLFIVDAFFKALQDYKDVISQERIQMSRRTLKQWIGRSVLYKWDMKFKSSPNILERQAMTCTLGNLSAAGINDLWYLAISLTNAPPFYKLDLS